MSDDVLPLKFPIVSESGDVLEAIRVKEGQVSALVLKVIPNLFTFFQLSGGRHQRIRHQPEQIRLGARRQSIPTGALVGPRYTSTVFKAAFWDLWPHVLRIGGKVVLGLSSRSVCRKEALYSDS